MDITKYDIPVPRYTSYPTVPCWQETPPSREDWRAALTQALNQNKDISLYIHLPYCEDLCTYCGCNKRITKNHNTEAPYIQSLLDEWKIYASWLPTGTRIREIHLGGGTPTFFQPDRLKQLIEEIIKTVPLATDYACSFEAHPNNTTRQHLEALYAVGFRRISIGVQDFDDVILQVINRKQTAADVIRVTNEARAIGYTSINYDLVYGLPHQTPQHIQTSIDHISKLRPDRIALYSYAHVPWKAKGQRAYTEADIPAGETKKALYETGRQRLEALGYQAIGMDHFALPNDELHRAYQAGTLHRNFMGYTPFNHPVLLGLGTSSISDCGTAFVQNNKQIEAYQESIASGMIPIEKGHLLNEEDSIIRHHIQNLMCRYQTHWNDESLFHIRLLDGLARLRPLEADGLVDISNNQMVVTEAGKPFVRNIAFMLDSRYWSRQQPAAQPVFSRAV